MYMPPHKITLYEYNFYFLFIVSYSSMSLLPLWFFRYKCLIKSCENCVLHLTDLEILFKQIKQESEFYTIFKLWLFRVPWRVGIGTRPRRLFRRDQTGSLMKLRLVFIKIFYIWYQRLCVVWKVIGST